MAIAHAMRPSFERQHSGFTLIELVAVIAIPARNSPGGGVFLRLPLLAYPDAHRRASPPPSAHTRFAPLQRGPPSALPNSVRVTTAGADFYLEFLQTRTGGRYRADVSVPPGAAGASSCPDANGDTLADENVLQFGAVDRCFTTLGALAEIAAIVPN